MQDLLKKQMLGLKPRDILPRDLPLRKDGRPKAVCPNCGSPYCPTARMLQDFLGDND